MAFWFSMDIDLMSFWFLHVYFVAYSDNSPGEQFPTVQVLVLMSGFILW